MLKTVDTLLMLESTVRVRIAAWDRDVSFVYKTENYRVRHEDDRSVIFERRSRLEAHPDAWD